VLKRSSVTFIWYPEHRSLLIAELADRLHSFERDSKQTRRQNDLVIKSRGRKFKRSMSKKANSYLHPTRSKNVTS